MAKVLDVRVNGRSSRFRHHSLCGSAIVAGVGSEEELQAAAPNKPVIARTIIIFLTWMSSGSKVFLLAGPGGGGSRVLTNTCVKLLVYGRKYAGQRHIFNQGIRDPREDEELYSLLATLGVFIIRDGQVIVLLPVLYLDHVLEWLRTQLIPCGLGLLASRPAS